MSEGSAELHPSDLGDQGLHGDPNTWELSPHRRLEAEFPRYQASSDHDPADPMTIEIDVPSTRQRSGPSPEFAPAFSFNGDMAIGIDGWIGLLIVLVLGLLSLLLGGLRWLWLVATRPRRRRVVALGTTTVVLSDEGLTCRSYDGTSHHVQWTLIDAIRLTRSAAADVLQIEWRLAETGEACTADIGPGADRGLLGTYLAKYAGPLYRNW